jgi:hypothetical protein
MSEINDYIEPTEEEVNRHNAMNLMALVNNGLIDKKVLNKTADRKAYNKQYNDKYYQQRKEKYETIICNICNGRYNKYTKSQHDLTNRHIAYNNKKIEEFEQAHPEAFDKNHPNYKSLNKFFIKKN